MTTPLELLTPDPDRIPSVIEKIWGPALGGAFLFGAACFTNFLTRKPILSGIQKHVLFTGAGVVIGKYLDNNRAAYLAERDAVLRHYVELHPEDFPAPERKRWADVIRPWVPVR